MPFSSFLHIIVEVEDLTHFFNGHWLQVISTIINSYLLLMGILPKGEER